MAITVNYPIPASGEVTYPKLRVILDSLSFIIDAGTFYTANSILKANIGTAAAPGIAFNDSVNTTGFYAYTSGGHNIFGATVEGHETVEFSYTGGTFLGTWQVVPEPSTVTPPKLSVLTPTSLKGKISITPVNNAGDYEITILNASHAAARNYTLPDAGADASFVMTKGTQTLGGYTYFGSGTSTNSTDSFVTINRSLTNSPSGSGHGYSDSSSIDRNGTIAYNSFDNRITVTGSQNYDHFAGFQANPTIGTSGTTTNFYALTTAPTINTGTLTNSYGVYVFDGTGTGTVTNQYGVYIPSLTKGSTLNYAIFTAGSTPSSFGGQIRSTATSSHIKLATASNNAIISVASIATADRTITIPDPGTNANFVLSEAAATINGVKTFGNDVILNGDAYTAAYQDYSGTSTIVGWTSFTIKQIYYKKIGKTVFVQVTLNGTSNSATTTFTLPYTSTNDVVTRSPIYAVDNGAAPVTGRFSLPANSATVTCGIDLSGTGWTASGTKTVIFQFFYQTP